jgi:hypothetical protein
LTDDQRKELRKREFLAYTRRNKASIPSSQPSTLPQPGEISPPPSTKKVVPPLSPLVHELLLNPTSTKDEIQLNIYVVSMFGKLNMMVPITNMCKIPYVRREILKLLQVPTEKEDPPIIFNTVYLERKSDNNPPFYISLGMNNLFLSNCMLYFGALANAMYLKVMKQIGLKMTQPYGNVCGIDFKRVKVYGMCENI